MFQLPVLELDGVETVAHPGRAEGGGRLGVSGIEGAGIFGTADTGGMVEFALPVSSDVHPPVLKAGAAPPVNDAVGGGGGGGLEGASGVEDHPPEVRGGSLTGFTDAQPVREEPATDTEVEGAVDVEAAPTVAQPDFLGPGGLGSLAALAESSEPVEGAASTVEGFAILMPTAFASLRSSFSSLFLSFSFRLSISSCPPKLTF